LELNTLNGGDLSEKATKGAKSKRGQPALAKKALVKEQNSKFELNLYLDSKKSLSRFGFFNFYFTTRWNKKTLKINYFYQQFIYMYVWKALTQVNKIFSVKFLDISS